MLNASVSAKYVHSNTGSVTRWANAILLTSTLFFIIPYFALLVLKRLYAIFFIPLNRIQPLGSVGYVPFDGDSFSNLARRVRRNRTVGNVPPVYPNGWFPISESFKLRREQVRQLHFCGHSVVLFRDTEGEPHVLDSYCAHLDAHLGQDLRVIGCCVQSCSHGWRFDGNTGKCTHRPGSDSDRIRIEQARVRSWNVCEVNQWIYGWFDAEERDPQWSIPEIPEITQGKLTYRGRTEHYMNGHIEEVPLNGADMVHLKVVHGAFIGCGVNLANLSKKLTFIRNQITANWKACEEDGEKHVAVITVNHKITAFGYSVPLTNYIVTARQIGPAYVTMELHCLLGKIVFLQCLLPVDELVHRIVHNVFASRFVPTWLAKFVMINEALQVERDLMIWNNKQYLAKPLLVKSAEDALLIRNRRWYSQFYSDNSPRLSQCRQSTATKKMHVAAVQTLQLHED